MLYCTVLCCVVSVLLLCSLGLCCVVSIRLGCLTYAAMKWIFSNEIWPKIYSKSRKPERLLSHPVTPTVRVNWFCLRRWSGLRLLRNEPDQMRQSENISLVIVMSVMTNSCQRRTVLPAQTERFNWIKNQFHTSYSSGFYYGVSEWWTWTFLDMSMLLWCIEESPLNLNPLERKYKLNRKASLTTSSFKCKYSLLNS